MKKVKVLLISLVSLMALVIAVLVAIPFFYSIDELRPQIQSAAEKQVHGKIELGKLSLRLFPNVRVRVDGLKVTPAAPFNKVPLAELGGFSLTMPLASFLIGPKATVVVDKPVIRMISKGTESNLATLLPPTTTNGVNAAATSTGVDQNSASQSVDDLLKSLPSWLGSRVRAARLNVEVNHGDATVQDLAAPKGNKIEIHDLKVALTNINLSAPIGIKVRMTPDVVMGDMKVSGPIKTEGTVTATPVAKGFKVLLDIEEDLSDLDAKMGAFFHKKAGVAMKAGVKGTVIQGDTINADLSDLEFRFGGFKIGGSVNVADATNPAKAQVKVAFKSGDTSIGPFGAIVPMIANFKLDGKFGLALSAEGPMSDPTVNVKVNLSDITGATPQLKHAVTGLTGKIEVQGTAKNPSVKVFPLSMKIGSSDISVKIEEHGLDFMQANVVVNSTRLDADELLGLEKLEIDPLAKTPGEKAPPVAAKSAAAPALPLDDVLDKLAPTIELALQNPMLDKVAATIVVDFKSIKALGAEFSNATFNMNYAKRELKISKTGINAYGGRLDASGELALDPKALGFGFKTGLNGVDLGKMISTHAPGWKNAMTGTMVGSFEISGKGLRKEQLAQNLAGGLKGDIKDGYLNLPVVKLVEAAQDQIPAQFRGKAAAQSKDKEYRGQFKTMKIAAGIKGRMIILQDLDISYYSLKAGLGDMRFQGSGNVSFDQRVDLTGTVFLSSETGDRLGIPRGPSGKSEVPLKFAGPMADPKPDLGYTAKIMGPRFLKNALKTKVAAKAQEQAVKAAAPIIQKLEQQAPAPAKKAIQDLKKKFKF